MNSWVFVTGASRGIGNATAKLLLAKGYSVICCSRNFSDISDENHDSGSKVWNLKWDLSELSSLSELTKNIKDKVGPLSGAVFCAGIQKTTPLGTIHDSDIRNQFLINTFSTIKLVSLLCRGGCYRRNISSFVIVSSIAGIHSEPGNSVYAATKGALDGFLYSASKELLNKGIRLNSVLPGLVKTDLSEAFLNKISKEQQKKIESTYPLGLGNPTDIAELILFLLSDKSKWITGQKFIIDGGRLLFG